MPDITTIKIGKERERSYKNFPANREFKKRAEDDNPGGGGWPSDLPKPSVGGYGYTEQGEQTVIVDNESVTTVDDKRIAVGDFATPFDIVDGAYTVIFNGTEYNLNSTFEGGRINRWYLGDDYDDFSQYPFRIVPFHTPIGDEVTLYTESAGDYEVTVVKKPSETIHKIDEKYLPASGGAMVVHFTISNGGIESDKTIEEVQTAMLTMPVVGVVSFGDTSIAMGCAIGWSDEDTYYSGVAFMPLYSQGYTDNSPHYMIRSTEDGWTSDAIAE